MKILVMKFGGTSVANLERIRNVASIIEREHKNYKLVIVLSAMAGVTDDLQKLINKIEYDNSPETDLILTSGEQISVALLSIILNKKAIKSYPMLGWQIPIITNNSYGNAKIINILDKEILKHLQKFDAVVVAGFQGISQEGKVASLGRGGSDTTAVAIAAALKAERCDIYTDVEGIYSIDPNIDKNAKKINRIAYEEILEMSSLGAKVLQTRSVELAMKNNINLQVLSSIVNSKGTMIVNEKELIEKEIVSGISYSKDESKISISGVPDKPGISAKIFGILSENNLNVDMIVQNTSQDGVSANLTFTLRSAEMKKAYKLLENNKSLINYKSISTDSNLAKVSVIGMGMKSQSGVAQKMFQTLGDQKINILAISTSEIKISVLIEKKCTDQAIISLHNAYKLNKKV